MGDVITKINDTPAENLTLLEAQLEIHESGRNVKIFVKGYEKMIRPTGLRLKVHTLVSPFLFLAT